MAACLKRNSLRQTQGGSRTFVGVCKRDHHVIELITSRHLNQVAFCFPFLSRTKAAHDDWSAKHDLTARASAFGAALLWSTPSKTYSTTITGVLPWKPNSGGPVAPVQIGPWHFFSNDGGPIIDALADRIIPADARPPAERIWQRRLCRSPAGRPVRHSRGALSPTSLRHGEPNQGEQSEGGPRRQYRDGLSAIDKACRATYAGQRLRRSRRPDEGQRSSRGRRRRVQFGRRGREGVFCDGYSGRSDGFLR
jgi:hypothetical protein